MTEKLRDHLSRVGKGDGGEQPTVFDASKPQMSDIPSYTKDSAADNVRIFHGREVRKVANAAGGMGFALQGCNSIHLKIVTKIVTKIIPKVQFEKEI